VSEYGFRIEGQFVAAALPFADNRSELVLITTREKPAKAAEFKPVFSWLSGEGFESHKGDVALPRFALSGANELLPALDDLGLAEARKSQAPLSAFSPGAVLSQVLQRVTIEADEQGAEAAAATAVITTRSLGEDSSIHLVVDKPFLFALRDRESGLILVSGYVGHAPKGKGD
jgi:serpin B